MAVTIGLQVIPQHGDYEPMKRAWLEADELGVDRIYNWDHFYPLSGDPEGKHFESRTIDHISGGRFVLVIGSGWFQKDYDEYGYDFGTAGSRLRDLDRALPLIKERWSKLNPPPLHRIPILIGGSGEKVTLRIVAEHADEWHSFGDPATMKHKSDVLDEWCAKDGRDPKEIVRSTTITRLGGERREPEPYLELGFTDFVVSVAGPDWDLTPLHEALAWRDTLN